MVSKFKVTHDEGFGFDAYIVETPDGDFIGKVGEVGPGVWSASFTPGKFKTRDAAVEALVRKHAPQAATA